MKKYVVNKLYSEQNRRWGEKYVSKNCRKYILIAVAIVFVFIVLLVTIGLIKEFKQGHISKFSGTQGDVCYTAECNRSADLLLSYMNKNADPCEDFYEFACGKYVADTVIPDDKSLTSLFAEVTDIVNEQLKAIVLEPITEDEPAPFRSMKNLYKSCMDIDTIEQLGIKPVLHYLSKAGGWPVLLKSDHQWKENNFSWTETIYKFRRIGYSADYFMDLSVLPDVKNSTTSKVQISEPSLTLRREYFAKGLNNTIVMEYYKYMVDVAVILGANKSFAEKEMKDALLFEMALSNITTPREEIRADLKKFYNATTVKEAEEKFPVVPWFEYINEILAPVERIEKSEIIIIRAARYLGQLEKLLQVTSKRAQANYLGWRAVQGSIGYLDGSIRNRQQSFISVISGATRRADRWVECVSIACGSFHIASGSKYVQKFFKNEGKAEAVEVVENIRQAMYNTLKEIDWMDDTTRENALKKAYAMVNHIAYPDELINASNIIAIYKNLYIEPGDYYGSVMNITKFSSDYSFAKLRELLNKTDWKTHSQADTVNAMYNLAENSMQFPAGILQRHFFSINRPKYINYGAIGFVVGHEITHAFDDKGSQYNENGNLANWWNEETWKKYVEKATCIVNQYSNYTVDEVGLKINGYVTQGENMADNNGVRVAYIAYNEWAKNNSVEQQLPNLAYNSRQMFWLSAASVWCGKYRTEALKLQVETGTHCPNKLRVIGSFSNQQAFSADFNCPIGSKMNPVNKCKVW